MSDKEIDVLVNQTFKPYLQELEVICYSIADSIDRGVDYAEVPIFQLKGKLSSLQGILKGIELTLKSLPRELQ